MKRLLIFFFAIAALVSCNKAQQKYNEKIDPQVLREYVFSYTQGSLSRQGKIEVTFSQDILKDYKIGDELPDNILTISPAIKGKTTKETNRIIVFEPEKGFKQGVSYSYTVWLNRIFDKKPKIDRFSAEIKIPEIAVNYLNLQTYSQGNRSIEIQGNLRMSDVVDNDALERALKTDIKKPIEWEHDGTNHTFSIKDIPQTKEEQRYNISIDLSAVGGKGEVKREAVIPGFGKFVVTRQDYQREEGKLLLYFSTPIDTEQNISSLITSSNTEINTSINGNILSVFFTRIKPDTQNTTIKISKDLKSVYGTSMEKDYSTQISLKIIPKPKVQLNIQGGIIPQGKDAYVPFRAISLRAVDITVIEVFPHNMLDFYKRFVQINSQNSSYISYVGRPVAEFTVRLDRYTNNNLSTLEDYKINLADYIEINKQSVYRVEIDFNRRYFIGIPEEDAEKLSDKTYADDYETPIKKNDYYSDYYYYNDDYYKSMDPYTTTYYSGGKQRVGCFIAVSNISLIAFQNKGSLSVIANDTMTGNPLSSAKIELYNLQGEKLIEKTTDNNGFVSFETKTKGAFIKANKADEYAYLYLSPDTMMDMSNYNIGGEVREDDLDAFIYGEREVWRPGDNIHLFLMLEDKKGALPEDYPVVARLIDPKGKVKQKIVNSEHINRLYYFVFSTDPDDMTGNWSAVFEVGGKEFTKAIAIETVKPNRMRTTLTFPSEIIHQSEEGIPISVEVSWLHGAPAKDTKVNISYSLFPVKTSFANYEAYIFDNPTIDFHSYYDKAAEKKTDQDGKTSFTFKPGNIKAPGFLKAVFLCRAYETGGDISINTSSVKYSPYTHYAGLMLPREKDSWYDFESKKEYEMNVVSVTDEGKPAPNRNLNITIYKINWWWWWHKEDDFTNFFRKYDARKLQSWRVTTDSTGGAKQKFSFDDGGRYLIYVEDPKSGHATGKIVYTSWWGRNMAAVTGNASVLFFFPDKEEYTPGEKAKLSFPSSPDAKLYLAVSDAYTIKKLIYLEAEKDKDTIDVEIDITDDFDSTMYIHAFLVQPYDNLKNDRPIRMYGLQPIRIKKEKYSISPVIETDKNFMPFKTANIKISEKNGKPMTYSLAIVDEGLLDITNFKTPDPYNYFYAKKAMLLNIWDTYGYIMSRSQLSIGKILRPGGGGMEEEQEQKKQATRFKPVVIVKGPFYLPPGKTINHAIDIPNYIGSVRIMVVARDKSSYGSAEKAVPVKASLMTLVTAPRVSRYGDTFSIPVNITASEEIIGNQAKAYIEAEGGIEIVGDKTRLVDIKEAGEQYIYFTAKTTQLGIGKITGYVEAGNQKSDFDFEIDVLPPSGLTTRVITSTINGKSAESFDINPIGLVGGNTYKLELSIIPPINLESRLQYLISYPYGCAEQTTSSVFPQIMLPDITNLTEKEKKAIEDHINIAIERLTDMQTSDGGFAYWPGERSYDWLSSYVGHFLILAKKKGYYVPSYTAENWLNYQKELAREWQYDKDKYYLNNTQAYRLYTLALAGYPDMSSMNRTLAALKQDDKNIRAKLRLAAAYAISGNKTIAKDIISDITDVNALIAGAYENDDYWWYSYGSGLRDLAIALETFVIIQDKDKAFKIAQHIAESLNSDKWMSTNTTAYCLYAIAQYINSSGDSSKVMAEYSWQNNIISIDSDKPIQLITLDGEKGGKLTVRNKTDSPIHTRVISSGYPPLREAKPMENLIKLDVEFYDKNSKPISPKNITQGTDIIIKITVENPSNTKYRNIALSLIVPSGWEILNQRLFETAITKNQSSFSYQDIRDDRIYTFFDIEPKEKKNYVFLTTAAYEGEFFFPSVLVEEMYNHEIRAESAAFFTKVLKADK
ncbi:MG2 domain-containing protein [Spirochaetia bacterium 38H-sp]|uniref:MG2 domain-containing protein n=1 Tax=Rarispira pelagica TaxID=3141764 RepID=A0ABU9U8K5_9SPIR